MSCAPGTFCITPTRPGITPCSGVLPVWGAKAAAAAAPSGCAVEGCPAGQVCLGGKVCAIPA